ncbi:MAG: diphthamide biosynthesis enzyme Dph2 [Candidatus Micrarchaeota archaeon]|nr:diphthamide biosynthesis enzyme Dph2 [Candidatus Micrarchaeota archaeon]MDE1834347.1 diphthamide biosynthesis enzyme Dph2 [Candidatus Micrarchaeota archaeon]MDE1860033.1 diphthamide biosynthesis enzyme Dph2 [Candidatus Micrarchaeota archaeon]
MRILLQFPEGLKQEALRHAKELEAQGNEVVISASPTFGACDLALDEARNIKADKLVHFGHAEFHHVDFNVEYIPYNIDADLSLLPKSLEKIANFEKIGLVTTIQHMHQLDTVKKFYEENGKKVFVGRPYGFAKKAGQILGCDIGSAASINSQVDAFVYFGGGMFHPLGALLATDKPFLVVEPFQGSVEFIDKYREIYRKRSRGKMLACIDAKNFGIMVTTKNGQHNMAMARILKQKIERMGLKAGILVANTFDFESLNNMLEFDAFVNTACPRISIDDIDRTRKPLLSANELNEVLRMKEELLHGANRTISK